MLRIRNWAFGVFPLSRGSLSRWGLERERQEQGFPNGAGASSRFQLITSFTKVPERVYLRLSQINNLVFLNFLTLLPFSRITGVSFVFIKPAFSPKHCVPLLITLLFCFVSFVVLGIKLRATHLLGKHSITLC